MQLTYLYTYSNRDTAQCEYQYRAVLPPSAQDYELARDINRVLTVTEEIAPTRRASDLACLSHT